MWTFRVSDSSGDLLHDGKPVGRGYAGRPFARNDVTREQEHDVGPIPRGLWTILGPPTADHGPFVLHLSPKKHTNTFGRGGFLIHGDSFSKPGTASEGCIVLPRPVREAIWESDDANLEVT